MLRRAPMMAIALASLACGAWLGLVRLGWRLPLPWPDQLLAHGPLMVCGFLGTLISLERAVALGSPWGYGAPVFVAAGALALDVPGVPVGPLLITLGSAALVGIFVRLLIRQPALFMWTMTAGAAAWLIGNVLWLDGAPIHRAVYWWMAFLVLTIAGERLELNRVLRPAGGTRASFAAAIGVVLAGVAIAMRLPDAGVRVLGAGLIALTAWLARYDVARRTIRQRGLTRYIAAGLLTGYVWLGFAGALAAATGVPRAGLVYDATLHAVFLGFVMSMVFAHAPVIFPAVLGRPLVFGPRFYAHLAVLHGSVLVRVVGDLSEGLARWRYWGGMLNAVALLLFVVNVGRSLIAGSRSARASNAPQRDHGVDPRRAPGRQVAGHERHREEDRSHGDVGGGVPRRRVEEQRGEETRDRERGEDADGDAPGRDVERREEDVAAHAARARA